MTKHLRYLIAAANLRKLICLTGFFGLIGLLAQA